MIIFRRPSIRIYRQKSIWTIFSFIHSFIFVDVCVGPLSVVLLYMHCRTFLKSL